MSWFVLDFPSKPQSPRSPHSAELLNLVNVVLEHLGLCSLVESIEFGYIIYLNVILYSFGDPDHLEHMSIKFNSNTYSLSPEGLYPLYSPLSKSWML